MGWYSCYKNINILIIWLMVCLWCISSSYSIAIEVSYDERALKIGGERRIILSGSIHYPRSTPKMWPELIKKSKNGGLNTIETYIFWNAHEPSRGQYDFSGNLDIVRFLKDIKDQGLFAILRIGPYACAEWNYGGLPVWLHNMSNTTFRTNNVVYETEMRVFTSKIVDLVRREKLFASQGGPIILAQIENEYGNVMSSYGDEGKKYMNWCANFADSQDIGVPWVMCQQDDAPQPMISSCNGYYCDSWYPKRKIPKFWTENWSGWYKGWGNRDPHRTAEDLAFSVARFFQYGGTLNNYYMYHGGTNFGRTSGGPYITTSYDYDAPLDEYGNLNQPKWGHLKQLHGLIKSFEKILTHGNVTSKDYGRMMSSTVYSYNGTRLCFFGNANDKDDITINFEGKNYTVPSWSVSILPNCQTEVYNTARVNTQTSVMVKRPNEADKPNLKWKWTTEPIEQFPSNKVKGIIYADQLLEQKLVTNDATDYLWYMTSVDIEKNDPTWGVEVRLQVNTKCHVLHAFVNGKHIGTQWAKNGKYEFVYEHNIVKLKKGKNTISLLSATVGLPNYGAFFDRVENGILGPVKLIAPNGAEKDLSENQWAYKVGLKGLESEPYKGKPNHKSSFGLNDLEKGLEGQNRKKNSPSHGNIWHTVNLPLNKMFVWYKTTFQTPAGEDPVVLDLFGLGKGIAWVNGNNIGRYWPSFLADKNGCNLCDYRGSYKDSKCLTNCGNSTQRWYHVPRSFLHQKENILVLFEEFGGNPSSVKVETITVGKAYGNITEGNKLELLCHGHGQVISNITFASFGDPKGSLGSFEKGTCESPNSLSVVQKACLGKRSCLIDASEGVLGASGCKPDVKKRLVVEVVC